MNVKSILGGWPVRTAPKTSHEEAQRLIAECIAANPGIHPYGDDGIVGKTGLSRGCVQREISRRKKLGQFMEYSGYGERKRPTESASLGPI